MAHNFPASLNEAIQLRESAYLRLETIQTNEVTFRTSPREAQRINTDRFEVAFDDLTNYLVELNRHIRLLEMQERAKKYTTE
jgi:hypothetical protein